MGRDLTFTTSKQTEYYVRKGIPDDPARRIDDAIVEATAALSNLYRERYGPLAIAPGGVVVTPVQVGERTCAVVTVTMRPAIRDNAAELAATSTLEPGDDFL
jgi:hypothetical protein